MSRSAWFGTGNRVPLAQQAPLFHRRVSTPLPGLPNGKDISFRCYTDDGSLYYCKGDKDGRPLRALEWLATRLAYHLGIPVAECSVIEDDAGNTYFGSRSPASLADEIEVTAFIGRASVDELGRSSSWLGRYFAGLFAFDLFIDNPDRCLRNFVLDRDGGSNRLCAIDFASARLMDFSSDRFPVESEHTVWVGRIVRKTHGAHLDSALEMLDRIAAVPLQVILGFVGEIPGDWLTQDQREGLSEFWSEGRREARLAKLRAYLEHESQI